MIKFSNAVDLFCKNIKTIIILFITNLMVSIPVLFVLALVSIIPGLNIILSTLYSIIVLNVTIMTFIECHNETEISFSTILNYYSQGLSNFGDLLKACLIPMIKMYLFILTISIIYFIFIFGSVMALKANSNLSFIFGISFILTIFIYIILIAWLSLKYTIEMNQKLACVYFNDTEFKYYEEYKGKTPISRYFWFFIPIIGNYLIPLAITKEVKDYYDDTSYKTVE